MQMDTTENPDGTYSREILQICYKKPIIDENGNPKSPYVESSIVNINLIEYPDLKALIEQATALAVPIALEILSSPPIAPASEINPFHGGDRV